MQKWTVVYYRSPTGQRPIEKFIESLDLKTRKRVDKLITLLTIGGSFLSLPYTRKLDKDLFELRLLGKVQVRLIYVLFPKKRVVILHGFIKKKQKTPRKEIKTALDRLQYISYHI